MTIDKLRRLWYLSTVPTHSQDSLKELHQLVREAVANDIAHSSKQPVCALCVNYDACMQRGLPVMCLFTTPKYKNFELRMEDA